MNPKPAIHGGPSSQLMEKKKDDTGDEAGEPLYVVVTNFPEFTVRQSTAVDQVLDQAF